MSFDRRIELRAFLMSRRAALDPGALGISDNGRRRVPGLRREEVATLAGVGLTWYTMFETGAAERVSDDVVRRVARALRLNEAEREYLKNLAGTVDIRPFDEDVQPWVAQAIEAIALPAYLATPTWDVLYYNAAYARAWNRSVPVAPFNKLIEVFERPDRVALRGADWEPFVAATVGMFRSAYGRFGASNPRFDVVLDRLLAVGDFAKAWRELVIELPESTLDVPLNLPTSESRYRAENLAVLSATGQWITIQLPISSAPSSNSRFA